MGRGMRGKTSSEGWRKVVLRSLTPPLWLESRGPADEVVISSRARWARNVSGYPFPHHAEPSDLLGVAAALRAGIAHSPLKLVVQPTPTEAERDFLVACRLISAEYDHRGTGRILALDEKRSLSLMVNEEDHLRFQSLTPGWSLREGIEHAMPALQAIEATVPLMCDKQRGYLTASPSNVGSGSRLSTLLHLIGLAQTGRLTTVLKALSSWGIVVRGLFGESSRAVGAFFQVSAVHGRVPDFVGACEYLIEQELDARARHEAGEHLEGALRAAVVAQSLPLGDALRIVSWVRWAACDPSVSGAVGFDHRQIDRWTAEMEVHGTTDSATADRHRAEFWRERLEPGLGRVQKD